MLKMEINGDISTAAAVTAISSPSPPLAASPQQSQTQTQTPTQVVLSPCAACKILRRRCAEKCVLAPYFPPTEPAKFTTAHRVFGASNIIKFLQELPETQRIDAVNSMVYEAGARIRDPVYGCAGAIYHLQKQVNELQEQLAKTQVELMNMQFQRTNLLALLYCNNNIDHQPSSLSLSSSLSSQHQDQHQFEQFNNDEESNDFGFLDDNINTNSSMSWWDPLWV